jgi:hypothetical protein
VIANRFDELVPLTYLNLISKGAVWLMHRKGIFLPDVTCGFRVWKRDLLQAIIHDPVKAKGFAFQLELLYRAFQRDIRGYNYPIPYILTNSTFKPGMIAEALRIYAGLK